jgi:hypothetical protein
MALCAILFAALVLRLYALDIPSQWWDEILVPLIASRPVHYILERTRAVDFHPPYYYLFVKAIMQFGAGDFALRLPSALAGTASVYVVYRLTRNLADSAAALLAAACVSGMPLHLLLSRQVRPYAIIFLCSCLTVRAGVTWLRRGDFPSLWKAGLWNVVLGLWHYSAFLFTGANFLFLVTVGLRRTTRRARFLSIAGLCGFLSVLPALLFYHVSLKEAMQSTPLATLTLALRRLAEGVLERPTPATLVATGGLCAIGVIRLWCRDRLETGYLVWLVAMPVALLAAVGYSSYFNAWHLFLLAPMTVLFLAVGLASFVRKAWAPHAAVAISLAFCVLHLGVHPDRYYTPESNAGHFKQWAWDLAPFVASKDLWVFQDGYEGDCTSWYIRRFTGKPLGASGNPSQTGKMVRVLFMRFDDSRFLGKDGDFVALFDRVAGSHTFGAAKLYSLEMDRSPANSMAALPYALDLRATPGEALRHAALTSNITFDPYFGCGIKPFGPGPGVLEYHFDNLTQAQGPFFFSITLRGESTFPKNAMRLAFRFDGAPWTDCGPVTDFSRSHRLLVNRREPFAGLDLRVVLTADAMASTMTGNPAGTLQFKALGVYANSVAGEAFVSHTLDVTETGIEGVEHDAHGSWRWGEGPHTLLRFHTPTPRPIRLDFRVNNPFPDQKLVISCNGQVLRELDGLPPQPWMRAWTSVDLSFLSRAGDNELRISYGKWNGKAEDGGTIVLNAQDKRPLAVAFERLLLNAVDAPAGDWHAQD